MRLEFSYIQTNKCLTFKNKNKIDVNLKTNLHKSVSLFEFVFVCLIQSNVTFF